jgi:hypothetical protein
MQRNYIEKNDIIEQYLLDRLSNEERKAFNATLQVDEELQGEVEEVRTLLYQKHKLPRHEEPILDVFLKREWLMILVLLILSLWYFFYENG